MSTSQARQAHEEVLRGTVLPRGIPITGTDSDEIAVMAMTPRSASGRAETEWSMLNRAVHAMEARDWPAVLVPISAASLRAPSFAYRVRDLLELRALAPSRLWLEADGSRSVIDSAGVVGVLARRHRVGCRMLVDDAFDERPLLPDLATTGMTFACLQPAAARSLANDLSALIAGRSLIRRARVHDISVIGPACLSPDMVFPPPEE